MQHSYHKQLKKVLSFIYSSSLCATYGATHGFALMMTHFLDKNDFIFVEDITFSCVVHTAQHHGLQIERG